MMMMMTAGPQYKSAQLCAAIDPGALASYTWPLASGRTRVHTHMASSGRNRKWATQISRRPLACRGDGAEDDG